MRIGDAQFDPAFSLRDDVADAGMVGLGFDIEGTPRHRVDLVVDGVSRAILHTRRTARAAGHGAQSTGHAVEGGATWGALGGKFVVPAGGRDHDALIAGVERGIYVLDFWYTRILDPRTQVVSGLTRNGVWLIEDGRISRALTNMRFTQSYAEALGAGRDPGHRQRARAAPGLVRHRRPRPEPPPRQLELHGRRQGLT